jgi:CBS domain-containing protein
MDVGELCIREVVIVREEDDVRTAARLMREFDVGTLVVVPAEASFRRPVGILTDRDLVVGVLAERDRGEPLSAVRVKDVMTRDPLTVPEQMDVSDALKRMRAHGVRRLPVVAADGSLVGIVAFDDLVDLLAEEMSDLAETLRRERKHERAEASLRP